MNKKIINTDKAPAAIGTYSQAVQVGTTVYVSGQIPLVPGTMEPDTATFEAAARRVFENLKAIAEAAGGSVIGRISISSAGLLVMQTPRTSFR